MNFKLIIFLAFANDKVDNTAYLLNIYLAQHSLLKAFAEAVTKSLSESVKSFSDRICDIYAKLKIILEWAPPGLKSSSKISAFM